MKLYYFDLYGKAECIRMTLYKAKVEFEDIRVSGDSWKELKESGKCPFGQVPLLELTDGTCLA
jgi:glutathione S-transferase